MADPIDLRHWRTWEIGSDYDGNVSVYDTVTHATVLVEEDLLPMLQAVAAWQLHLRGPNLLHDALVEALRNIHQRNAPGDLAALATAAEHALGALDRIRDGMPPDTEP